MYFYNLLYISMYFLWFSICILLAVIHGQEPIAKLQAAESSVFASRWEQFTPYIAETRSTLYTDTMAQWEFQDPKNGGTVPYKAIFCGDIPLHRPK